MCYNTRQHVSPPGGQGLHDQGSPRCPGEPSVVTTRYKSINTIYYETENSALAYFAPQKRGCHAAFFAPWQKVNKNDPPARQGPGHGRRPARTLPGLGTGRPGGAPGRKNGKYVRIEGGDKNRGKRRHTLPCMGRLGQSVAAGRKVGRGRRQETCQWPCTYNMPDRREINCQEGKTGMLTAGRGRWPDQDGPGGGLARDRVNASRAR